MSFNSVRIHQFASELFGLISPSTNPERLPWLLYVVERNMFQQNLFSKMFIFFCPSFCSVFFFSFGSLNLLKLLDEGKYLIKKRKVKFREGHPRVWVVCAGAKRPQLKSIMVNRYCVSAVGNICTGLLSSDPLITHWSHLGSAGK